MNDKMKFFINPDSDLLGEVNNVIVIDDDESVCKMLCHTIIADCANTAVLECTKPETGSKLLEKIYFDAVVCDINMPNMFGDKVIGHIKSLSPTTYTIAITGFNMNTAYIAGKSQPDFFLDKNKGYGKFIPTIKKGIKEATSRRQRIFSKYYNKEKNEFIFKKCHWREMQKIERNLGFKPRKYFQSLKILKALSLLTLKKRMTKEEIAFSSGFSSYQRLKQGISDVAAMLEGFIIL
jgi:response regulator RpfG family c-di-GMP phosphodiesterase